jgi:hypothetical protein
LERGAAVNSVDRETVIHATSGAVPGTPEGHGRDETEVVEVRRLVDLPEAAKADRLTLELEIGSGMVSRGATSGVLRKPNETRSRDDWS